MGAGHKEKITAACDVMNGLRLSLSRRRTIELGLAVGMAFSATGSVRAAAEPPEVFFSPEVSADALIRIYEKLSGDLSGRVGIKIHGGEAAVNLPLFRALQAHIPGSRFIETNWASVLAAAAGIRPRILPKYAARASTLRRWTCSTERSVPRIM